MTDALFVPLLIGAVYQWDRFVSERGPAAWRGPVLLGLALAVKQTPWLILPFLLAGIAVEAHQRGGRAASLRTSGRYLGIALLTFAVPNLPFIVMTPHAWLSGVLTPVASHTVPAGQGLVGLTLFLGLGGGSLAAYTVALVVVFVALWLAYLVTYPTLKAWAVVCPALVLFFSARSFGSYLVTLLPAALVAAASIAPPRRSATPSTATPSTAQLSTAQLSTAGPTRWRHRRWVVSGGVAASVMAIAAIFVQDAPLSVRITSVRTTGQLATVVQLGVDVANHSGRTERPSFTVESGGQLTAFWLARGGPASLPPGAHAHYTLLAPNFFGQPPITGGFQVVAFGTAPATVSRSSSYLPTTFHLSIDPMAVNNPVPVGRTVVLHAEVLDKLNRPVHLADAPVYLGQVIYGQQGLIYSQTVINQGQPGQTPVVAYTDADGVATFDVRGTRTSPAPVYFEANLVNTHQFYPYGYSEIVPIRFGFPP